MSLTTRYTRVAQLKTPEQFSAHLQALGVELPFDAELQHGAASPLAQKYLLGERVIGNRFCVQPMEGWDGETNGMPTGPRNGLVSGCYPLDPFYKNHPEHELLKQAKK